MAKPELMEVLRAILFNSSNGQERFKKQSVTKYGENLGNALFDSTYRTDNTEAMQSRRALLIKALTQQTRHGTDAEAEKAWEAAFEYFDYRFAMDKLEVITTIERMTRLTTLFNSFKP